jgi:hypothetical protein
MFKGGDDARAARIEGEHEHEEEGDATAYVLLNKRITLDCGHGNSVRGPRDDPA